MQLGLSQQMRMRQEMRLAPRMIQSMEILQLPMFELQERIDQELAENVCLEQANEPERPRPEEANGQPAEEAPARHLKSTRPRAGSRTRSGCASR